MEIASCMLLEMKAHIKLSHKKKTARTLIACYYQINNEAWSLRTYVVGKYFYVFLHYDFFDYEFCKIFY